MSEQFISQGAVATEPEPIKENVAVLTDSPTVIGDAGGGLIAKGDITPDTVQTELEKIAKTKEPIEPKPIIKDLFSTMKEEQALEDSQREKPVEQNQPVVPQVEIPATQWETEKQAYLTKIQTLESQLTFQNELEKDPLKVMSQFVPGVVLNKESPYFFDPDAYVLQKIKSTYGDEFMYQANEAYRVGTSSYNYRKDVEKWESEAKNTQSIAQQEIQKIEQYQQAEFNKSKSAVMMKYGIDEVTFKTKIMDKLEAMTDADRLAVLSDALMIVDKNSSFNKNVNNGTNTLRVIPPSPTDILHGNPVIPIDNFEQAMEKDFGKPYGTGSSY